MCGTTLDEGQTVFGKNGSVFAHCDTESQRDDRRKPPARYEAIAIAIMLLIVAIMPLFSH